MDDLEHFHGLNEAFNRRDLGEGEVVHVYRIRDGLVDRMDVEGQSNQPPPPVHPRDRATIVTLVRGHPRHLGDGSRNAPVLHSCSDEDLLATGERPALRAGTRSLADLWTDPGATCRRRYGSRAVFRLPRQDGAGRAMPMRRS
jgi:hypothetical protein